MVIGGLSVAGRGPMSRHVPVLSTFLEASMALLGPLLHSCGLYGTPVLGCTFGYHRLWPDIGTLRCPFCPFWDQNWVLSSPITTIHQHSAGWDIMRAHLDILGLSGSCQGQKGILGPISLLFLAPFWVKHFLGWNVGIWGVQSIAAERPTHTTLCYSLHVTTQLEKTAKR